MKHRIAITLLVLSFGTRLAVPMTVEERRQYLHKLQQIIPDVKAFDDWLAKTGELPPDFDSLPRVNRLPEPLQFLDGRPVRTSQDWTARRTEIREQFQKYVLGTFPPRPKILRVTTISETQAQGASIRDVNLEFERGKLSVELVIPNGKGPFPVLMGPGVRNMANMALSRGYMCVQYAGSDGQDDSGALRTAMYPDNDLAEIPLRAWGGSIALDYLLTLPEVDKQRVAMTGHSRDGKQALIAAAFDDRISAVIPSSSGAGGTYPYRYGGEKGEAQGVEDLTARFFTWYHPRLRFFTGREDRLPVDGNLLLALVAPRPLLVSYGLNDTVEGSWADEQAYYSALKAYKFLGHPERIGVKTRPGGHAIGAIDHEEYFDWLDIEFGRSDKTWNSNLIYDHDFDRWRTRSGETLDIKKYPERSLDDILKDAKGGTIHSPEDWERKAIEIRKTVGWALGDAPPVVPAPKPSGPFANRQLPPPPMDEMLAQVLKTGAPWGWRKPESDLAAVQTGIRFGQGILGDLFYPASAPSDAKLPTVVYLHSEGYASGYLWSTRRADLNPILALVKAGYAVFAFDQIGFGKRVLDAKHFSDRFPHWSEFGQMVTDTRAAIDAAQANKRVDPEHIYLFGYSMGATLGLYTAALDPRVKGVISVCGFTPMRLDTAEHGAGGIARYSQDHDFMPRLGFFIGQEKRIPYDFHELIGSIAPRPVLVVQPRLDRDANPADVHTAVEQARGVYALYGAAKKLELNEPWDYNRLPEKTLNWIVSDWMSENLR